MSGRWVDFLAVRCGPWKDIPWSAGSPYKYLNTGIRDSCKCGELRCPAYLSAHTELSLTCLSTSYWILAQQCRALSLIIGRLPVSFFARKIWILGRNFWDFWIKISVLGDSIHIFYLLGWYHKKVPSRHEFLCAHFFQIPRLPFLRCARFIKT